ncbi:hypothetical protein [Parasphingorhabdus sp.]|uniref:hypothetical protein n=1 Tax=Parasphingorhabdus sp. TaxID=2709688 RepID=UPI003A952882
MPDSTFTQNGKQILRDGQHYAEGATSEAASEIVDALNVPDWLDSEANKSRQRATARAWRIAADNIRAKFHRVED